MAADNEGRTVPSRDTRAEEQRDAQIPAGDRAPGEGGPEADPPTSVDGETRENYQEMLERGANQKGEGRLP